MKRAAWGAAALILGAGCLSLDSFWFNPIPLEAYEFPDRTIPEGLQTQFTLPASDGGEVHAIWIEQDPEGDDEQVDEDRSNATVLYLHGNCCNIDAYYDRIQILYRLGFQVLAIDYRGYGMSPGSPTEEGIYADGRGALEWARRHLSEQAGLGRLGTAQELNLAYYGFSLGSTIALQLASEHEPAALITEAALASAQDFADDASQMGVPSTTLMSVEFDNIGKIAGVEAPTMIMHGDADNFVRVEYAVALFEASASGDKRLRQAPLANHGDVPCEIGTGASTGIPCAPTEDYVDWMISFYDDYLD